MRSTAIEMRDGRTGQVRGRIPLDDCENRYGAPYYLLARFDLHALLASLLPDGVVELGKACESVAEDDAAVRCRFADGTSAPTCWSAPTASGLRCAGPGWTTSPCTRVSASTAA
ncbi:hypothetical protein [Saccharopolyspora spinosa]|uniref:hypothetical protein n=1 Tax=Saccharopolyspora spinosa TaxID=60894 RepID=UPI0002379B48|nr:hypothetical protein [Saccharopolyspora spinosa]